MVSCDALRPRATIPVVTIPLILHHSSGVEPNFGLSTNKRIGLLDNKTGANALYAVTEKSCIGWAIT